MSIEEMNSPAVTRRGDWRLVADRPTHTCGAAPPVLALEISKPRLARIVNCSVGKAGVPSPLKPAPEAIMLFMLSCPVPLADGGVGVMIGTGRGARIRRFRTRRWAGCYHALLLSAARAAVEAPMDIVLIDDAADDVALRDRVEREYGRRGIAFEGWPSGHDGIAPAAIRSALRP